MMKYNKICITGTPGTGKTTLSKLLSEKLNIMYINANKLAEEHNIIETDKNNNKEINPKKLCKLINSLETPYILDSHIAQNCKHDLVIVLRASPDKLEARLKKRKWSKEKIKTNLKSEILDSCLIDAIENNENVYEIDTTTLTILETLYTAIEIINNNTEIQTKHKPGYIDWTEKYFSYLSD